MEIRLLTLNFGSLLSFSVPFPADVNQNKFLPFFNRRAIS
jgi:hypothetical protein